MAYRDQDFHFIVLFVVQICHNKTIPDLIYVYNRNADNGQKEGTILYILPQ